MHLHVHVSLYESVDDQLYANTTCARKVCSITLSATSWQVYDDASIIPAAIYSHKSTFRIRWQSKNFTWFRMVVSWSPFPLLKSSCMQMVISLFNWSEIIFGLPNTTKDITYSSLGYPSEALLLTTKNMKNSYTQWELNIADKSVPLNRQERCENLGWIQKAMHQKHAAPTMPMRWSVFAPEKRRQTIKRWPWPSFAKVHVK